MKSGHRISIPSFNIFPVILEGLFCLGAVGFDEFLQGVDADLDGAGGVLAHGHEQAGLFTLLVPDDMEAAAAANAQSGGDHEHSGGFHFAGLDAQTLPAFPFLEQFVVNRGLLGAVLTVECILALDNTGVGIVAQLLTGGLQKLYRG